MKYKKNALLIIGISLVLCVLPGCHKNSAKLNATDTQELHCTTYNAYSDKLQKAKDNVIVLKDKDIKKINRDSNPLLINESVTIVGESDIPLTAQIYIAGGRDVNISGLCFDGEEYVDSAIVIEAINSNVDIHSNTFKNHQKNAITVKENHTKDCRKQICIYENQFVNWGKAEGLDGAINLCYTDDPELLVDIQTNEFQTAPIYNECALVYGTDEEAGIFDSTVINWATNNIVKVSKDKKEDVSITSKIESGVGLLMFLENDTFTLDKNREQIIVAETKYTPWGTMIIPENTTLVVDGVLELEEGVSLVNKGTVLVGESGEIRYKDKSQLIGVNP